MTTIDIDIDRYANIPRDLVVLASDYPDGMLFPAHAHRRGQFAYAARGVISVHTEQGNWVVPPQRAVWVPAGLRHSMRMRGPVSMLNSYIRPGAARRLALPSRCQVCDVSPLLRQLLLEAPALPTLYAPAGRDGFLMGLLLREIAQMPALALNAPLPAEPRLAAACDELLAAPSLTVGIDAMAARVGMSRRSFTRQFRLHTGVSFVEWRQQACLLAAVVRLGNGEAVTRVAVDLGYSSPGAFAAVFRRALGDTPSHYFKHR